MAFTPPSAPSVQREAALVTGPRRSTSPCPSTGALGLIVVTRRPAVRLRVAAVSAELDLPEPIFCDRLDDAPPGGTDVAVVLDLGCCRADAGLPRLVRLRAHRRPESELILFVPLLDRDAELETVLALLRAAGDARLRVMTASDFYRDETWRTLAALRVRTELERELRAELLAAVARTGRTVRAEPEVLALLAKAPRQEMVDARVAALLASAPWCAAQIPDGRAIGERQRKARWKQLRRAGQMSASSLLLVFRVLWFAKLRECGWSTAGVAGLLGFTSPREFRRAIRRRLGIGVRALRRVRYADVLEWAAQLVVAEHTPPRGAALRGLAGTLLNAVAREPGASVRR